jgi:hypothetical protein
MVAWVALGLVLLLNGVLGYAGYGVWKMQRQTKKMMGLFSGTGAPKFPNFATGPPSETVRENRAETLPPDNES